MCKPHPFSGDVSEVEHSIRQLHEHSSEHLLSYVAVIAPFDATRRGATYKPIANPWKLPEGVLGILPEFEKKTSSSIFRHMFSEVAKTNKGELQKATFWRAFLILWKDVWKEWETLCTTMVEGTISLADIDKVFRLYKSQEGTYKFSEIGTELEHIAGNGPKEWVEERITQFRCWTEIKQLVDAADVMLKLKRANDMSGKFEDIEKIFSLVSRNHVMVCCTLFSSFYFCLLFFV